MMTVEASAMTSAVGGGGVGSGSNMAGRGRIILIHCSKEVL